MRLLSPAFVACVVSATFVVASTASGLGPGTIDFPIIPGGDQDGPSCGGGAAGTAADEQSQLYRLLCPDPTVDGASCVSHGLLVIERDNTGGLIGDAVVDHSQSRAWTWASQGPWPSDVWERNHVVPPGDPSAHADAHQVGVSYTHGFTGLSVDAKVIGSQCDVLAVFDPDMGLYTEAYGRGYAADVEVGLGGPILDVDVLEFEVDAVGLPWFTSGVASCDIAYVYLLLPLVDYCPFPNTALLGGAVTVTLNEQWGPVPNSAGQWVYGGAALHVRITGIVSTVDVYVGYAAVAVTGGPPMPIMDASVDGTGLLDPILAPFLPP